MAAKSKRKGSSFEREVCTMLSLFVTGGERTDIFWRSSISGGRSTVAGKGKLAHVAGDICAVHPLGADFIDRYFVECKHYADLDIARAVMSRSGKLVEFFNVACTQAASHNKDPLLIFKQNRGPVLVASTAFGMDALNILADVKIELNEVNQRSLRTVIDTGAMYIHPADKVFAVPKRRLRGKREDS